MGLRRLWLVLALVIAGSFSVLGYYGAEIYREAPPIPNRVVEASGAVLFTGESIQDGQSVWQSLGGHNVGSIWGHGAYLAPDWSADWLHREANFILDAWARQEHGVEFSRTDPERQAVLKERLKREMRTNTYDPATGTLTVSAVRAEAMRATAAHYRALFRDDPAADDLRKAYSIPANSVKTPERMEQMNHFFFWTAWSCVTNRPGKDYTYTNNWPPEELVGNRPQGSLLIWTGFSVIVLITGVGLLGFYHAARKPDELEAVEPPTEDPLQGLNPTPSMKATMKYFWVVSLLILVQIGLGVVGAHYGVEGGGLYGIPLADFLPYAVVRTWHLQLGIFWIATSWLATGLFIAPAVSGHEPRWQRAGVNFLFVCLLIIVAGSLAGQWFGVMQKLGIDANFWFGHQGYEYVELGRFWQAFLFVGLFVWLALLLRALWPAFRKNAEQKHLLSVFVMASSAIALFYGAGLMWGKRANLAVVEYWRWWVVHLWVEGFFEIFATTVIAFLFVRMRLLRASSATRAVLFSTIVFLTGGIVGTFHHLYFTGTPTAVLAWGASFSALEIVPLVLIGFEAYHNLKLSRATTWVKAYKWPIYFFVAVAFWNLVGAGIFGFLINPPIALYYMQGLNTTPLHGHTALFGVYGNLGIGLMLFCLKGLEARRAWRDRFIALAFWGINLGLAAMALFSLLPIGVLQTLASVDHGMWYARSAEFSQTPLMEKLRWARVFGDTIFALGALALAWFILGLKVGFSCEAREDLAVGKDR